MNNNLHKAVELTNYQNQYINFDNLKSMGYDTVIIECGGGNTVLSQDYPYKYFETHYNQAINAGFNIGFYFWVYSNVDPKMQAQEFYNLIKGKRTNCKFVLDVELGSTENTKTNYQYGYYNGMNMDQITQGIVENMKNILLEEGISNISDDDFVVYSSRSFAQNNLSESIQKYNFWVADPTEQIPTIDSIPTYNGESFNWIGWQWQQDVPLSGIGSSCDLDVFKDTMYFKTPIIIGQTKGNINSGTNTTPTPEKPKFKSGDFVKIDKGQLYFAPIQIPNEDKNKNYKICNIAHGTKPFESTVIYKLDTIGEWVTGDQIKLIKEYEPINNTPHTSNGKLLEKEYIEGNLIKFKDSTMQIPINIPSTPNIYNLFNYNDVNLGYYDGIIVVDGYENYPQCPRGYSNALLDFIKNYEKLSLVCYIDATGHPTIGWGHEVTNGEYVPGDRISLETATKLLEDDLLSSVEIVRQQVALIDGLKLNQSQFDAMVSFTMNAGYSPYPVAHPTWDHPLNIYFSNPNGNTDLLRYSFTAICSGLEGLYDRRLAEFIMFEVGLYRVIKDTPIMQLANTYNYKVSSEFNHMISEEE